MKVWLWLLTIGVWAVAVTMVVQHLLTLEAEKQAKVERLKQAYLDDLKESAPYDAPNTLRMWADSLEEKFSN